MHNYFLAFCLLIGGLLGGQSQTYALRGGSFSHERYIETTDILLEPYISYEYEIVAPHDRDTFIYLAPRAETMVITRVEADTLDRRSQVRGAFYVTEPETLQVLYHAPDLRPSRSKTGGYIRIDGRGKVKGRPKKRYYYDYTVATELVRQPIQEALVAKNWTDNAFKLKGGAGMRLNLYNSNDIPVGRADYVDLSAPIRTRGFQYLTMEVTLANSVSCDLHSFVLVASERPGLVDPVRSHPIPSIRENNSATFYLRLPDTLSSIRSLGLMFVGPGTDYSSQDRCQLDVSQVALQNRPLEIGEGEAGAVIKHILSSASPGDTLDFGFRPIYLGERVDFGDLADLTVQNLFLYDTVTRGPNRGNSQHWISLSNGRNITLRNTTIFGARNERTYEIPRGDTVALERWVSRHYDPRVGPTNRIDMWGHAAGDTLQLFWDSKEKFAPSQDHTRPFLSRVAPSADTVRWNFQLPHPSYRYRVRVSSPGKQAGKVTVNPWDVTDHIYAYEFSSGFKAGEGARNVRVYNSHVETLLGDGLQLSPGLDSILFRGFTSVGMGRQGISVNGGYNIALYDFEIDRAGRSLFDVEPYDDHWLVYRMKVRNFHLRNAMALGYISGHDKRVFHADVDGFYCHENVDQCWRGGTMYGRIRNVHGRDLSMGGRETVISEIVTNSFRLNGGDTKVTPFGDTVRMGYNVLKNSLIKKRSFEDGDGLIVTDSTNRVENVRISADRMVPEYNDRFGLTKIAPNTRVDNLVREDLETFFPNMLPENYDAPIGKISARLESRRKTYRGSLDGKYTYRAEVLVPGDSPRKVPLEDAVTVQYDRDNKSGERLYFRKWRDIANGRFYQEFNLYRYPEGSDTPDTVYRIRKTGEDAANSDFEMVDTGDTLIVLKSGGYYGYPTTEIDGERYVYFKAEKWDGPLRP
jgi:hypothetical protein